MARFEIDKRLADDSFTLGEFETSIVLLMNNKVAPWFVLVPKVVSVSELYELDESTQALLWKDINCLSKFIKSHFTVDKLNVAAIGNIVKQLHIHVVARTEKDHCWPGVVWGTEFSEVYPEEEVSSLANIMLEKLEGFSK